MELRWWCSAGAAAPWEWTWRPYPGVWIALALLVLARRSLARPVPDAAPDSRARRVRFALAVALFWLALDWPVGALGGGYLASLHMLQFLLVGLVAPPLLLTGLPPAAFARLATRPRLLGALRVATHPVAALALFNAILVLTHLPRVVDRWMPSQAGSFATDALWLAGGLALWWPVLAPVPVRRFPDAAKIGYLFADTIVMGAISLFLVFGDFPLWGVYELAPRVAGIGARADAQAAGVLMKVGGMVVHWTAITWLFFRWYRREEAGVPETLPRGAT